MNGKAEGGVADPGLGWSLRTAWRDSRGQKRLLLLFSLSVVFGIAALVAIRSFRANLLDYVRDESRTLLGADMVWRAQRPFGDEALEFARDIGGRQARELRFRSMGFFPQQELSRFVEVRAVEGGFPFYGDWETLPASLRLDDVAGQSPPPAIVEEGLMTQLGLSVGDTMRLGQGEFRIAGALVRVAGESEISGFFAPRVYIPRPAVEATGLLQFGSLVEHRIFFAVPPDAVAALDDEAAPWRTPLTDAGVRVTTAKERQERLSENFGRLFSFLNLVGLVALLLGALGIGGAVQVYLREKLAGVALWRCLGAPLAAAYRVYWIQVLALGSAGALAGVLLGVAMQMTLPHLMGDFLPADVQPTPVWTEMAFGAGFGALLAVLCGWVPLLAIRRVTPLAVLRQDALEESLRRRRDPVRLGLFAALGTLVLLFCWLQMDQGWVGLAFAGGFALVALLLGAMALGLRAALRRLVSPDAPYVLRVALSSLYRPQNRTVFLVVTLGAGVFLVHLLAVARQSLIEELRIRDSGESPNVVMIDIQPDQRAGLSAHLAASGFPVRDELPIVTMRLASIRGIPLSQWNEESDGHLSGWVPGWEFRVTHRGVLLDNERLTAGEWTPRHDSGPPIPISIAASLLDDIPVNVGDALVWDVQGVPVESFVGSVRDVDWDFGRMNFGIVFPDGWIEDAPATYAATTRASDRRDVQRLQALMRGRFGNVSLIDLSLVFETLTKVMGQAELVVRFLAGFTIATGLLVLVAAVLTSRYQRRRESALLRTLGASGRFVLTAVGIEYALIGAVAGAAGVLLAWAGGWALVRFVFEGRTVIPWGEGLLLIAGSALLTALAGFWLVRSAARAPVLEVLRREVA